MSNRHHLSNAETCHLQIVIFKKQWSVFLFAWNKTFCPKKVFWESVLLVLLGDFFLPTPPWPVGRTLSWINSYVPTCTELGKWAHFLNQSKCSRLFSSFGSPPPSLAPEHWTLNNCSEIYLDYYRGSDTPHGCLVHALCNCTVPILRVEFRNLPTLSTLQR